LRYNILARTERSLLTEIRQKDDAMAHLRDIAKEVSSVRADIPPDDIGCR
jgi:hypothetical protein